MLRRSLRQMKDEYTVREFVQEARNSLLVSGRYPKRYDVEKFVE